MRLVINHEYILLELHHVQQVGHRSSFHPLPPVQYRVSKAQETNSVILIHSASLQGNQPLPVCRNTGIRYLATSVLFCLFIGILTKNGSLVTVPVLCPNKDRIFYSSQLTNKFSFNIVSNINS